MCVKTRGRFTNGVITSRCIAVFFTISLANFFLIPNTDILRAKIKPDARISSLMFHLRKGIQNKKARFLGTIVEIMGLQEICPELNLWWA